MLPMPPSLLIYCSYILVRFDITPHILTMFRQSETIPRWRQAAHANLTWLNDPISPKSALPCRCFSPKETLSCQEHNELCSSSYLSIKHPYYMLQQLIWNNRWRDLHPFQIGSPTSNSILMKKFTASIRIGPEAKASPLKFPHQRGSDQRAGNAIVQKNKKVRNRNSQTLDWVPDQRGKVCNWLGRNFKLE